MLRIFVVSGSPNRDVKNRLETFARQEALRRYSGQAQEGANRMRGLFVFRQILDDAPAYLGFSFSKATVTNGIQQNRSIAGGVLAGRSCRLCTEEAIRFP